jgi:hypothetical protein
MTRKNLFPTTAITAVFLFLAVSSMAQDSYLKNRWNFKLSGAPQLTINSRRHNAFLMAEANYGILNHIEVGIALGFENTKIVKLKPDASNPPIFSDYSSEDYISPLYNLHLNYHLMPYLVKEKNPRFDFYLTGKLGGLYQKSDLSDQSFYWNYFLGGGLSWFFTRNVGVYTEYGKRWPINGASNSKMQTRFGVAVKF